MLTEKCFKLLQTKILTKIIILFPASTSSNDPDFKLQMRCYLETEIGKAFAKRVELREQMAKLTREQRENDDKIARLTTDLKAFLLKQ